MKCSEKGENCSAKQIDNNIYIITKFNELEKNKRLKQQLVCWIRITVCGIVSKVLNQTAKIKTQKMIKHGLPPMINSNCVCTVIITAITVTIGSIYTIISTIKTRCHHSQFRGGSRTYASTKKKEANQGRIFLFSQKLMV